MSRFPVFRPAWHEIRENMDQSEIPDHGNRFVSQLYDGFLNISIILICSSLMLPVSSSSIIWGFCGSRITSTGAFFMLKIQRSSSKMADFFISWCFNDSWEYGTTGRLKYLYRSDPPTFDSSRGSCVLSAQFRLINPGTGSVCWKTVSYLGWCLNSENIVLNLNCCLTFSLFVFARNVSRLWSRGPETWKSRNHLKIGQILRITVLTVN